MLKLYKGSIVLKLYPNIIRNNRQYPSTKFYPTQTVVKPHDLFLDHRRTFIV